MSAKADTKVDPRSERARIEPPSASRVSGESPKNAKSGTALHLKLTGTNKLRAVALLSRVWASSNVGIYVDVPLAGTPEARFLAGRYAVYAVEKTSQRVYRSADFGVFNPRMGKDGVEEVCATHDIGTDGAPTVVRIHFTAKPHKVGGVLANLLARMQFDPPSSDLSSLLLCDFPKDIDVLRGAAKDFYTALQTKAEVALIGGKKSSVRLDVERKFEDKYKKVFNDPKLGKTAAPAKGSVLLAHDMHAFEVKAASPAAAVVIAQSLSSHGVVSQESKAVHLTTEPFPAYYAHRVCGNALTNTHRVSALLDYYQKQSERDAVNNNDVGTVLAIAGITCGLLISSMTDMIAMKALAVQSVVKSVVDAATALKAEKVSKPAPEHVPEPVPGPATKSKPAAKPKARKAVGEGDGDSDDSDSDQ